MARNEQQKLQVQQANDIADVIGEQLALRPKGKDLAGLCPFHDDKNPSMLVSRAKQIYKCFSCGAGGDVFSFVMQYHKMDFPEALKYLADRVGIVLEQWKPADSAGPNEQKLIAEANGRAVNFYVRLLEHPEHGRIARQYIEERGISPEMVKAFQLGYAPDRWDGLALTVKERNWSAKAFELAGLTTPRQGGDGCYDRLRHRLIFPIHDHLARPIAFGGRKLRAEDEPKYLNSPETQLFNKSATLYGLHLAKKPIIDSRVAVIVEGYTDVIACHQAGERNVVATLGTALTRQHVHELRRYCDKVVLIFDGDEAGQKAADRAVEIFLAEQLDVGIAVLPGDDDPDTLMKQPGGPERWRELVANATDALQYQFQRVAAQLDAADTLTGRQRVAESYIQTLAQLGMGNMGSIRRAMVVTRLSEMLHLPEQDVRRLLERAAASRRPTARPIAREEVPMPDLGEGTDHESTEPSPFRDDLDADGMLVSEVDTPKIRAIRLAERHVIGALIQKPDLFHATLSDGRHVDEAISPPDMVTRHARELFQVMHDQLSEGQHPTLAGLLADLAELGRPDLASLVTDADEVVSTAARQDHDRIAALLNDAAMMLHRHHAEQEYRHTRQALLAGRSVDADEATAHDDAAAQDALLRRITEQLKANPSPAKIAMVQP